MEDEYLVSKDLMKKIGQLIVQKMNDFYFPVYSAAFFLCPAMHPSLTEIFQKDRPEYDLLLQDTLDVLVDMYRRFEPNYQSCRDEILTSDDPSLAAVRNSFQNEL
jgi:hypothetical protein